MLLFIYRVAMFLIYVLARVIGIFYRSWTFQERLGFHRPEDVQKLASGYNVWLHAASAGEVNAITPFCQAFRKAKPEARIVLTTTSAMGRKIAMEKGVADHVFLAPLDEHWPLKRAFNAFRPVMVLVAETEFWPNWLRRAGQNGLPVLLINGRVSDRSFPRYQKFKRFFRPALECFALCLVQTRTDADRLEALGVSALRIQVAGQMKYDRSAPGALEVQNFKEKLFLLNRDVLFTLGSLRSGEDDQVLSKLPEILALDPSVKVLIAPRHMKNVPVHREKLKALGIPNVTRSELEKGQDSERVMILDSVGELSLAYALSRAAFVGGTLVPIGGHNVMEPALSRVPVCFGPYTQNVGEAAQALIESGGGVLVNDGDDLVRAFQRFMDPPTAREAGERGHDAVLSMRGATERTVTQVLQHWPLST
ncbi:MAG TPA: glycosyltransferase N-terminal domain-containing protein [bacterium]|nr:glycosyltransferase N-terminal domain-containing protein [bacterium]